MPLQYVVCEVDVLEVDACKQCPGIGCIRRVGGGFQTHDRAPVSFSRLLLTHGDGGCPNTNPLAPNTSAVRSQSSPLEEEGDTVKAKPNEVVVDGLLKIGMVGVSLYGSRKGAVNDAK